MKNFKIFAIYLLLMGTFTACDLDVVSPTEISAENFWQTEKDAWYGLNACYETLSGVDIWDELCTDNAHSHKPWEGNFELVQQGGVSTNASYGSYSFSTVRLVNNFMEKVDNCDMSDDLKKRTKAEARFFRAFNYLDLTTKFGKVAIVKDVLEYNAPVLPRNEVSEVRDFILSELADIATILPESYDGTFFNETGRITRYGALALRARAALYFGNYKEAEASAQQIISSNKYSLFHISSLSTLQQKEAAEMDKYIDFVSLGVDKEKFIKGLFSYESLWHAENANLKNPEYVVTREYMADPNNYEWSRYTYFLPSSLSAYDGYCSFEPMQDIVDAYWDVDGKTMRNDITPEERSSRYKTMWNDFKDFSIDDYIKKVPESDLMKYDYMQEFRNRDSRLYASIMFPFKGWHETVRGAFYFHWDPEVINKNGNESWSGYSFRKMIPLDPYDEWAADTDYPTIRYAEVLLTFAEAHFQNKGYDAEVRKALNEIRERCGMPDVPSALSSDEAIKFIRNERRIELAGEGQRFDDIRRYGNDYASNAMQGPSYSPNGYTLINKGWSNRMMLMPIPQEAIDLNPLLEKDQNPGY